MKVDFKDREFREGSMGAKEQASFKIWRIVIGVVYLLILGVIYVFPNYQNDLQERQGAGLGLLGFVFIVASYGVFYFIPQFNRKIGIGWLILAMVALLFFGWQIAIGFDGRLDDIAPR